MRPQRPAGGGCARAVVLDGLDHVRIILALAAPGLALGDVMPEMARFIDDPAAATCPLE